MEERPENDINQIAFSGAEAFWNIFYDKDIKNKLNYKYKDIAKYDSQNCYCSCHKSISDFATEEEYGEFENGSEIWKCCFKHHDYMQGYNHILKMINDCKKYEGYVFLNLDMVSHNINMRGDSLHPYISGDEQQFNKELILLLKEPGEIMTLNTVTNVFNKVKNTLEQMSEYHFNRRCFYFEGIEEDGDYSHFYNRYIDKDITKLTDSYKIRIVGMMQKMNKKYENRDKYAEYSSDMFYDVVIKNKLKNKTFSVRWSS